MPEWASLAILQLPKRTLCEVVVEDEDPYRSEFSDASSDSSNNQPPWSERFPDIYQSVSHAINQLGGRVAPKLMWSTPTDAVWVSTNNSLMCTSADQVGTPHAPPAVAAGSFSRTC
jgi:hypothetical protein